MPTERPPASWPFLLAGSIGLWLIVGFAPLVLSVIPTLFSDNSRIGRHYRAIPVEQTGQVGDSFGLANSLFSALGVAGVAYALILQAEERKQAAASDKESARLTLLTALIHARAAMITIKDADLQRLRSMAESRQQPPKLDPTLLDLRIQSRVNMVDEDMADLFALAHYAGHVTGWHEIRDQYLTMLEEDTRRQEAEREAEATDWIDRMGSA